MYVMITQGGDFPHEPFDDARNRLASLGVGGPSSDGKSYVFPWQEASAEMVTEALDAFLRLVGDLVPQLPFVALEQPVESDFVRNDHNIWVKQVPALSGLLGRHLRGELIRAATGAKAAVTFAPLAAGQPGWKPRFVGSIERTTVWPPNESKDQYKINVWSAAAP
jgi:hypothetical protein